jgi:hypothetical protein
MLKVRIALGHKQGGGAADNTRGMIMLGIGMDL